MRDEKLMISFIKDFGCGHVNSNKTRFDYRVSKFDDILNKIIPFFQKYPIQGVKVKDFLDLCRVAELMKDKKHLSQ